MFEIQNTLTLITLINISYIYIKPLNICEIYLYNTHSYLYNTPVYLYNTPVYLYNTPVYLYNTPVYLNNTHVYNCILPLYLKLEQPPISN